MSLATVIIRHLQIKNYGKKKADPKYLACEWRLMCGGVNQTILHCLTGDSAAESLTEADDSTDLEETEPTVYSTPA